MRLPSKRKSCGAAASSPSTGNRTVPSGCPVTSRLGPMHTATCRGSWGSAASTFQPARSIARTTTGSRALPASIAVSESSLGGFVGS